MAVLVAVMMFGGITYTQEGGHQSGHPSEFLTVERFEEVCQAGGPQMQANPWSGNDECYMVPEGLEQLHAYYCYDTNEEYISMSENVIMHHACYLG